MKTLQKVFNKVGYAAYNGNWTMVNNTIPSQRYNGANNLLAEFKKLEQPEDKVFVEYLWHDAVGGLRGKTRVIDCAPDEPIVCGGNLGDWSYDGSSTNQASGGNSDIKIVPMSLFPDPFRGGRHLLAMCETFNNDGSPLKGNSRAVARKVFEKCEDKDMIFAFEQEYCLLENNVPLGWPQDGSFPADGQGQYYCACGDENSVGRQFVEAHAICSQYAGLAFEGINQEVMFSQWEYQVGPLDGVAIGDHLEISRYLLQRLGEMFGWAVTIHPKPVETGGWNGSGNHCNVSSLEMRQPGGLSAILDAVYKLEAEHGKHMEVYGEDNEKRLSGLYETQHISKFSCGVADRGSSIRIQRGVFDKGYGWFEDRRPASNCDPWLVTARIAKTLFDMKDLEIAMEMAGIDF